MMFPRVTRLALLPLILWIPNSMTSKLSVLSLVGETDQKGTED
jgi:hypothetical protein